MDQKVRDWLEEIGYISVLRKPPSKIFLRSLVQQPKPEWEFLVNCAKPVPEVQRIKHILQNSSLLRQRDTNEAQKQTLERQSRFLRNKQQIITLKEAAQQKAQELKERLGTIQDEKDSIESRQIQRERSETLRIILQQFQQQFKIIASDFDSHITEPEKVMLGGVSDLKDQTYINNNDDQGQIKKTCTVIHKYLMKHVDYQLQQNLGVAQAQGMVTPGPTPTPQWLPDSFPSNIENLRQQITQMNKQGIVQNLASLISWLQKEVEKKSSKVDLFADVVQLLSQIKEKDGALTENVQDGQHAQNAPSNVQNALEQLNQGFITRYEHTCTAVSAAESLEDDYRQIKQRIKATYQESSQFQFLPWESFEKVIELDCQVVAQRELQDQLHSHLLSLEKELQQSRQNKEKLRYMWQEIQRNSVLHDRLLEVASLITSSNKSRWQQWNQKSKSDIESVLKECISLLKRLRIDIDRFDQESYFHEVQNTKYVINNFNFLNLSQLMQVLRTYGREQQQKQQKEKVEKQIAENTEKGASSCRSISVQFGNVKGELTNQVKIFAQDIQMGLEKKVRNGILQIEETKKFVSEKVNPALEGYLNPQIQQLQKWVDVRLE